MTKMIWVMLSMSLLAATGCKKKEGDQGSIGESAAAVAASPECKEAAERVQELILRKTPADAPDSDEAYDKSRVAADKVAAACTKDKWPAAAIACVKATEKLADCQAKLTPEQQKSLPAN